MAHPQETNEAVFKNPEAKEVQEDVPRDPFEEANKLYSLIKKEVMNKTIDKVYCKLIKKKQTIDRIAQYGKFTFQMTEGECTS